MYLLGARVYRTLYHGEPKLAELCNRVVDWPAWAQSQVSVGLGARSRDE